ncbi:MAG: hypothetical protein Q9167_007864 [Letrouitia subvulpina]
MARVNLPLTPASSLDISAREGTQIQPAETALSVLPPPALGPAPVNTTENKAQRLQQNDGEDVIYLLPPFARATKIIQMKPKQQKETRTKANNVFMDKAPEKLDGAPSLKPKPTKIKQPGSKSQLGKKTARKTAHSVIERRRRSYLNCEFETLKNLIPACQNREMHKLAILQASVDYIRYLEQHLKTMKPGPSPSPLPLEQCGGQNIPRDEPQSAFVSPVSIPGATTEADEEATAVLLTLNKDRRNNNTSNNGRSISVRDLLST